MDIEELVRHPKIRAMLNVIRTAEGADYNTRVGGSRFSDLSRKPGQKVYIKSINDYSSAEGAYQFLNSTWDSVSKKLGLKDFQPYSQDLGAVYLMKQRGAIPDILNDNFESAINKLSLEWASLPTAKGTGAYKGQKARKMEHLKKVYGMPVKESNYQPSMQTTIEEERSPIMADFSMPAYQGIVFSGQEDEPEDKLLEENFAEEQEQEEPQVDEFIPQFQNGGTIPISPNGMWEYPKQDVIVPTSGHITMEGIDYPILGTSLETGETKLMQPNKNYFFKNTKHVYEKKK